MRSPNFMVNPGIEIASFLFASMHIKSTRYFYNIFYYEISPCTIPLYN
jgi:hypothetical protein